jgi:hypothetical protein
MDNTGFEDKCHGRLDFVCDVLNTLPDGSSCETGDDCSTERVCLSGECNAALTVCLPACGSDADCSGGLYCNYSSGLCVEDQPTGKDFNEPCDPEADNGDDCIGGFCFSSYDDETQGTCGGLCNLGNLVVCGYDGEGPADSACVGTIFSGTVGERGDLGLCTQLCDCSDDCTAFGEVCRAWETQPDVALELYQRAGYCTPVVEGSGFTADDAIACDGSGGAGAGGMPIWAFAYKG